MKRDAFGILVIGKKFKSWIKVPRQQKKFKTIKKNEKES